MGLSGSLSAGLTVKIPVPELDTEAVFYVPFSYRFYEQVSHDCGQRSVGSQNIEPIVHMEHEGPGLRFVQV